MENSASQKHIKVVHHFKFQESEMKWLEPEQFVSSPVFHALGTEWVIDCYPQGSCQELCLHTSFIVRLRGKYKVVNPTISLSLLKRDGTTYTLPKQYLKRDEVETFTYAIQKSLLFGNSMNSTDTPQTFEVVKSFDLHSQIGKLLESTEKADVTSQVENRSFMCYRLILAAGSPVLNAELFGNMAEATEKHIKIKDMSPEVFEGLLHFIYTDSFPCCDSDKSSMKMAQHLIVASDRYAIQGLKALCEDMLCGPISLDTITTTLAQQLNSTQIKNACLDFIVQPGTLAKWMLGDKYEDLVRSFPSIMDVIRARVDTGPPFKTVKKRKII